MPDNQILSLEELKQILLDVSPKYVSISELKTLDGPVVSGYEIKKDSAMILIYPSQNSDSKTTEIGYSADNVIKFQSYDITFKEIISILIDKKLPVDSRFIRNTILKTFNNNTDHYKPEGFELC